MKHTKDPDAKLDYKIDWSPWLEGDTITTSEWNIPTALTASGQSNTGTDATIFLQGGKKGETYTVTNRITTSGGRIDDRSFTLEIKDK